MNIAKIKNGDGVDVAISIGADSIDETKFIAGLFRKLKKEYNMQTYRQWQKQRQANRRNAQLPPRQSK